MYGSARAFVFAVLTLAWAGPPPEIDAARKRIEAGDARGAQAILQPLLARGSKDPLAYYLLGVAQGQLGAYPASNRSLKEALRLDPSLAIAYRFLGSNALESGEIALAESYTKRYLQVTPDDPVAHLVLAQVALNGGQFGSALRHFEQAREVVQGDGRLELLVARALAGNGQVAEAKKHASEIRDSSKEGQMAMAGFFADLGELAEAEKILEPLASDADALGFLGEVYRRQGRSREAESAFRKALILKPEDVRNHAALIGFLATIEGRREAIPLANQAIGKFPKAWELYALRAGLYSLVREWESSEADYRRAFTQSGESEAACSALAGFLAYERNRLEDALALLQPRLGRFRGYYAKYLYADVARKLGLERDPLIRARMQKALEGAVQLNPGFSPAQLNLGRLYASQKEWTKAKGHLEAALQTDPQDKAIRYELSRVYQQTGEEARAREMLASVSKLGETESSQAPSESVKARLEALVKATGSGGPR